MGDKSKIDWTDATWNPVTGCTKVSAGCKHCYAETMAYRLKAQGLAAYQNGFDVTLQPDKLKQPLHWKRPRRIFVNSMSDLFHEDVPDDFIHDVFDVMSEAHWHTYQVLTKRPERIMSALELVGFLPSHIWIGTSVERADTMARIDHLVAIPAVVRFLSLEPLLGPLERIPLMDIDWVIVGGESGPKARPMDPDWARNIRDQCQEAGVPFFMKQMSGRGPIPNDLQIRQYPRSG